METIVDFHMHSKYAMACSPKLDLEHIDFAAKQKGIGVMGSADFTHASWMKEIKENFEPAEEGLYTIKDSINGTRFLLSVEVANIYRSSDGTKKIHNVVLMPSIEEAEQFVDAVNKYGLLNSDGRPILSISVSELVEIVHEISKDAMVIPAHIWTPYFGALGSISGYDSIEDAYEDQAMHIYALETGLSSDPPMNWMLSKLDKYALVSNSDAHSAPKMGREANIFSFEEGKLSYEAMIDAIKNKDRKHFKSTIEFYPEEGKYHNDGHRFCNVSMDPKDSVKHNNICPVCHKKLTVGVLHRVRELADREPGFKPKEAIPYVHTVPLLEVISEVTGKGVGTQYVNSIYAKAIKNFGTEFNFLLNANVDQIRSFDKPLASAIESMRLEKVHAIPGYDGVFGIIDIMNKVEEKKVPASSQKGLFA